MKQDRSGAGRRIVILTGLSGSGKGTILKAFEDLGFYCIDNLPVDLLPTLSELAMLGGRAYERVALLVDARERENLQKLPATYRRLARKYPVTLVFVEASDVALLRRFSETRRPHPLSGGRRVGEGIRRERRIMAPIRRLADTVIDTSPFNVHELRKFVIDRFQAEDRHPLVVSVVSFAYRFGIPADADLVFDVRFLPNPHFVPGLRRYSGRERKVARYVLSFRESQGFLRRVVGLLVYLLPRYVEEGKSYLTIAFGCTGGRHRSVALSEAVARALEKRGYGPKVIHRDIDRTVA
ncbi:MAG TPA: RNase adapter RapZ [Candidatus Dormibacteraeota bacterium]|nr:RNase adapter RapZ [Candidatus Dormibacteraeota bacterium]